MEVKIGNLFTSKCSTKVNTVNCVGVMGKGIALEFKKLYPEMFNDYQQRCALKEIKPGHPYFYKNSYGDDILNFPTKDHWRSPSRISYIKEGLDWFVEHYKEYGITEIAFPPLGCGNGGLSWSDVGPLIYQKLNKLPITIELYAPFGTKPNEISIDFLSRPIQNYEIVGLRNPKINPTWYLILETIKELNEEKYSLKVGKTIYQKICYVLTRNGVDTGFSFIKGTYGPYSKDVDKAFTILANDNLVIEEQLGKMTSIQVLQKFKLDFSKFTSKELDAVKKTVDLFCRIQKTSQAEFIATVLFSYDQLRHSNKNVSDIELYHYIIDWKPRWKGPDSLTLCDTIQKLAVLSQIDVSYSNQLRSVAVQSM